MRLMFSVLGLAALVSANAQADVPSPETTAPADEQVARSIWQIDGNDDATHLQSGLACPASNGIFRRVNVHAYKADGLDVSCNYRDGANSLITIYLTRRHGQSPVVDFEEAKRELVQVTPSATPLPDAQQVDFSSDLKWQRIVYSENDGALHSGLWIADLHGWTLEYRATYAASNEATALDEMTALTAAAEKSAGPTLAICEKTSIPVRDGSLNTDKDAAGQALLLASLLGAVVDKSDKSSPSPRAITWCAEGQISSSDIPMLLWHGAYGDGSDASIDKVTPEIMETPPSLTCALDEIGSTVAGEINGKMGGQSGQSPRWIASIKDEKKTWLFAVFAGRPSGDMLATLMADIVRGKAKSIGGYSNDRKSTTIDLPTESK